MNTSTVTGNVGSFARRLTGSPRDARAENASAPSFCGLTMAQAQDCLDWLQNHGWRGYTVRRDGDRWNVFPE